MMELLRRYVSTKKASEKGLLSVEQCVVEAVRRFLYDEGVFGRREGEDFRGDGYKEVNHFENRISVREEASGRIVDVYRHAGNVYFCDACLSFDCLHVLVAVSLI
jgi:hypothetical protein